MSEPNVAYQVVPPQYFRALWYRLGQLNSVPVIADVTQIDKGGVASLTAWPPNSTQPYLAHGVRHAADPYCQSHPDAIKEGSRGVWEYVDAEKAKQYSANEKLRKAQIVRAKKAVEEAAKGATFGGDQYDPNKLIDVDALEPDEIILQLTNAGIAAVVIADTLREKTGDEWSHQRVTHRRKTLQGNPLTNANA